MARHIKIKARVKDVESMQKRVERIAGTHPVILRQEDICFHCRWTGQKLRLRIENDRGGKLIQHFSGYLNHPATSFCQIVEEPEVEELKKIFGEEFGVRGIVKKQRKLYVRGNARIHLDKVDDLGDFIELELEGLQTLGLFNQNLDAQKAELMRELGISQEDLVYFSYIDLLERERNEVSNELKKSIVKE